MDKSPQNPSTSAFSLVFTHMNLNGRLSAAVESDIVGYTTMSLTQEWTLVATNLAGLEEDDASINSLFSACVGLKDGDQIQVQNETGSYNLAYWNEKVGKWCNKGNDTPSELRVKPGYGVWMKAAEGATHSVSVRSVGRIKENSGEIPLRGYTIISIPVPLEDVSPNDPRFSWDGLKAGDQLQIPNAFGSYNLAYWNEGVQKWCNKGNDTPTEYVMPMVNGCWLVTSSTDASFSFDMNK